MCWRCHAGGLNVKAADSNAEQKPAAAPISAQAAKAHRRMLRFIEHPPVRFLGFVAVSVNGSGRRREMEAQVPDL